MKNAVTCLFLALSLCASAARAGMLDSIGSVFSGGAKNNSDDANRGLAVTHEHGAVSDKRVALVIGNSAYTKSPLKNPVNDARDMAAKLRKLGFTVIEHDNLKTRQIGSTLSEFRSKLSAGAVALVFYAGHGIQIKGENYLPAVDAEINAEEDVANQSLAVRQIMDVLDDSKTRLNLVFLDACRNNPYSRGFRSAAGEGLAKISAPSGTLISYATRPGSVAQDGEGHNGLYTSKLLAQMDSKQQIELTLKRVVSEVKTASQGKQEPWMEGSIEGDFCFAGCAASGGAQVASLEPAANPATGKSKEQIEDDTWKAAESANILDAYEAYLSAYPNGRYVGQARIKIAVLKKTTAATGKPEPVAKPAAKPEPAPKPAVERPRQQAESERHAATSATLTPGAVSEPEMVRIPGGSFEIGSSEQSDNPVRTVSIRAFEMGKYPVTQKEWKAVMGNNPSKFKRCGDNCPVEMVSWDDIQTFLQKLNAKTGRQYRLPTEEEWEVACYGGNKTEYCGSNDIDSVAWYGGNSGSTTHPVGQKQANGYGLYDMSGNVWEWMANEYSAGRRALRGGSWYFEPQFVRAACRSIFGSSDRIGSSGFRVARTLPSGNNEAVKEPEMVKIPGGSFEIGSSKQSDNPVRTVSIRAFEMGKYLVTQGEWKAVMGNNPSNFQNCGDNCPVEQVSWDDIQKFLKKLNAKTGRQYRLPTEEEWEVACYGGNKTEYCGSNDIDAVAWYGNNRSPGGNSGQTTHPVGQKQANGYGLYDMSGNVWEWMANWFNNIQNGRAHRGGSWGTMLWEMPAASRFEVEPTKRFDSLGFRVARTLP